MRQSCSGGRGGAQGGQRGERGVSPRSGHAVRCQAHSARNPYVANKKHACGQTWCQSFFFTICQVLPRRADETASVAVPVNARTSPSNAESYNKQDLRILPSARNSGPPGCPTASHSFRHWVFLGASLHPDTWGRGGQSKASTRVAPRSSLSAGRELQTTSSTEN